VLVDPELSRFLDKKGNKFVIHNGNEMASTCLRLYEALELKKILVLSFDHKRHKYTMTYLGKQLKTGKEPFLLRYYGEKYPKPL